MKRLLSIMLFTACAVPSFQAQQYSIGLIDGPEKRVALVIGNSAYRVAPLPNPVNDARDMAQALVKLGFDVIHKENATQNEMKAAIRTFGERINSGAVGLFYFAGHGVQVNGENFLIPVNAVITKEQEIEYESVNVGLVIAQMENAKNIMNIVILDACRNNPFARSFRSDTRGLAYMSAPSGTLIAYATAPGSVASDGDGKNGLYTQELLKSMSTAGLRIEDVFKRVRVAVQKKTDNRQVPWESSSLVGDFYFLKENRAGAEMSSKPSGTASTTDDTAKSGKTPDVPVKPPPEDKNNDEPNIERIEAGKSKRGSIAEGQRIEYKFAGVANAAWRFAFQKENSPRFTTRYVAEIYDSRGQQLKRTMVYLVKGQVMVFTPQTDGWYIFRLTGEHGYGNYTIHVDQP